MEVALQNDTISFEIKRADEVQLRDIVVIGTNCFDVHCIGDVLEISKPHDEITEFRVMLVDHYAGKTGEHVVGLRHHRKVAVIKG